MHFALHLGFETLLSFDNWILQVSVAPGGRWSRFKTYSTIQRTLEIWGFVFTFIFRAWLNNQKFSYRGQLLVCGLDYVSVIIWLV